MSVIEFGHFVLTFAVLLVAVHGLGYIAERLKQPRIVGEILAGIVLGPRGAETDRADGFCQASFRSRPVPEQSWASSTSSA